MNIAQSQHAQTKTKAPKKKKAEAKLEKAWQKVVRQQQKNESLKETLLAFKQEVHDAIREPEKDLITATQGLCQHLLGFYPRKSLTLWQREELLIWLNEGMEEIVSNPFTDSQEFAELRQSIVDTLGKEHPEVLAATHREPEPEPEPQANAAFKDDQNDEESPLQEDMFGFTEEELETTMGSEPFEEDPEEDPFQYFYDELEREQQAYEQRRKEDQTTFNQLFKSSSVNQLFRKLARLLHPDLEQDEALKKQKHQQMSQLTTARDNNDILSILQLYSDCTGQSPMEELGGDLKSLTQLLDRQYQYLLEQQDDIVEEDPIAAVFYHRFYRSTQKQRQKAIKNHLEEIRQITQERRLLCREVTSLAKLKPYLESRRFQSDWDDIEELMAIFER